MSQILIDANCLNAYLYGTPEQQKAIEVIYPGVRWNEIKNELIAQVLNDYAAIGELQFDVHSGEGVVTRYNVKIMRETVVAAGLTVNKDEGK